LKTYTVSGALPYRGHEPGETFKEDIPPGEARRAIACGSIREGGGEKPPAKKGGRRTKPAAKKAEPQTKAAEAMTDEPTPAPEEGQDAAPETPASPGNDE
jgi:hypothetical protein